MRRKSVLPRLSLQKEKITLRKRLRKWRGRIKLKLLKISLWHVCSITMLMWEQEIPPELYQAVAEVLAAVYKAKNIQ